MNAPGGKNTGLDEGIEAAQAQINAPAIDALLEQIDTVMETDAQAFVEGFVQKGGE
ncbi:MAG: ubiquitin-like protein Pup [Varibaculum cambriense]|nr:ubiquitin-like protein Pup [Varibaculum cambriense]